MTANPYGPPHQPQRPADPGALFRVLAGILGFVAAALVVAGSFLPQTSFEQIVDGKTETSQTISAWSRSFGVEPSPEAKKFYDNTHVARYGIPLSAGAAVLLAGAGLAVAGAARRPAARIALIAGGAGVTAAVWMLSMDVSATLSYESEDGAVKSHYATGTGFWVLLGGGVFALLTALSAILAGRRAADSYGGPGPYPQYPGAYPAQGGPAYPAQAGLSPQPYPGGPSSQPFPAQAGASPQPYSGGPSSHPFPAQPGQSPQSYPAGPSSQPFPAQPGQSPQPYPGGPTSQPFPAQPGQSPQPYPGGLTSQPFPGGPPSQPFPAQPSPAPAQPDEPYGGVTRAEPYPGQQESPSPTQPNYQLPPLNPPNT